MVKIYRIYKCVNLINGKVYIGYTNKPLEKRIIEHKAFAKKGSNYLFHKAIRKYGVDSFEWQIIFESLDRSFLLTEMEEFFIREYNSYFETGFGYNMTFGGQSGMTNRKHSEETKLKMKEAWKNRINFSPMSGKKHSILSKQKMSISKTGKKLNNEYKKMCSERNKKRYQDPEKRKVLSDAIKLFWQKRKLAKLAEA